VLALYEGYVAGYNAYLASGQLHDPACAGQAWVRPITLTDMFLRGLQIVTAPSSAQFITNLVDASPPSPAPASAKPAGRLDVAALQSRFPIASSKPLGSNGIAVGSDDTVHGDGLVLANPHFPWRGTERFWMAQLTVPLQYNVLGGTLEGFPLIGIGFNQHVAWTHTNSTDFRFTLYQLKLVPGDPTSYYVDGQAEKMGRLTVSVDDGHGTQTHTFYTTRWGTVVVVPQAGYGWSTTTAYALADGTATDGIRAANQYFVMGQSDSVQDLLATESTYLAIPTFNTMAADDTGHVLYSDVGNTPNVTPALITACVPAGQAQLVYAASGVITLDGSRSSCAWGTDPNTPVPGIFNASHMPHTIRTDFVENSNDSYWLANPSAPFPAFSPIIGNIDTEQGFRTRIGDAEIAARVAGTDSLGPPKFTIPTLQAMWAGDQSLLAQLVLRPLVAVCRAKPTATASDGTVVDLAPACTALAGYDGTGRLDAAGGWLFAQWNAYTPSDNFWADAFDPAHPLTTPSRLNPSNPAILTALADAVLNLRAHHVALDATYGDVQHATRGGVAIPIPGCDTGCLNVIDTAGMGTDTNPLDAAPYGEIIDGSSLVMTTELTPTGPVSEGILTYSQASNPTSPWSANMTTLYSQGKWVPLAFTPTELKADGRATSIILTVP
jgi:acyl-homoserine-lactone acylase